MHENQRFGGKISDGKSRLFGKWMIDGQHHAEAVFCDGFEVVFLQ